MIRKLYSGEEDCGRRLGLFRLGVWLSRLEGGLVRSPGRKRGVTCDESSSVESSRFNDVDVLARPPGGVPPLTARLSQSHVATSKSFRRGRVCSLAIERE